jgi:predicted nucleic acid-binding protein
MRQTICNATPLINFSAIERLDILHQLFTVVVIPQAVYKETIESWRVRSSLGWDKKKRTARPKEAGNVRNWLRRNIDSQRYLKLCNYASE